LRHTIDRIAILSDEPTITAETVRKLLPDVTPNPHMTLDSIADELLHLDVGNKLSAIEYTLVTKAMKVSNGNKSEAARLLGVHRKRIERGLNALDTDVRKILELCTAADLDLTRSAYQSTLNHYGKAEKLLAKYPLSRRMDELRLEILVKQGICQRAISGWNNGGVSVIYEKAIVLGKHLNRLDRLAAVTFGTWAIDLVNLDLAKARQTAETYLEEGKRLGGHAIMPQACIALAGTHFWTGEYRKTESALNEFIEHYRHDENLIAETGHDPFVFYLMLLTLTSFQRGRLRQARETLNRLTCYAERISHAFSRAIALHAAAWVEYLFGDLASANCHAEELIRLSESNCFPFYEGLGMIFSGVWLAANGHLDQGTALIRKGFFEKTAKDGGRFFNSMYGICLADAYCRNARWADALKQLEPAIELSRQKGELCYLSDQLRLRGRIHLAQKNHDAAEKDFRTAMFVAEHQGARTMELRSRRSLYRLLLDTGRETEAAALERSMEGEDGKETDWSLLCGKEDLGTGDQPINGS
jgi:tetratricopeptide (TPR) repeat protein